MPIPFPTQLPVVHSAGKLLFDPVWAEKQHQTPTHELVHVIRGRVQVVMGRQRIAAKPGDTLLIPARTPHRDDFDPTTGLEVFLVFFSWSGAREYFARVPCNRLPLLPEPVKDAVAHLVLQLRHDFAGGAAEDDLLVRVRVGEILLRLLAGVLRSSPAAAGRAAPADTAVTGDVAPHTRRQWLMQQAKAFLETNYQRPVALDDIARALRVSPYHLSHVFSAESDFSLFEFLTRLRMEKARELLADGRRTVAEVAYAVGFDSSGYFSKVFHRHHGLRPSDCRGRDVPLRSPQQSA